MNRAPSFALTRVMLTCIPERINVWLRFGHPVRERCIDATRRQVDVPAGVVLGRVHWQANEYGTTHWSFLVLRTVRIGEPALYVAGVEPGADVLLSVNGADKVRRALALIDVIEAQRLDAADVSPAYWRTVHNRLVAHQEPPFYDGRTHVAFLTRRKLQS
jgi:hypothetical protein